MRASESERGGGKKRKENFTSDISVRFLSQTNSALSLSAQFTCPVCCGSPVPSARAEATVHGEDRPYGRRVPGPAAGGHGGQ